MRPPWLFILILAFTLPACAPQKSSSPKDKSITFSSPSPNSTKPGFQPEISYVELDWTPENVEVVCAADRCPLQVGALMFAGAPSNGMIPIRRCTAFLTSADTIMSNGHCDGFGKDKGYFVTQKLNGEKQIREITGVPFKRFTAHPKGEKFSSGRPDVAVFTLSKPVRGVPPLRLASGPQMLFDKLIVFAIMNSPSEKKLTIEKQECLVRRHESEFPFELIENPDMIYSYDCRLEPGTSGSPMFAAGSEEVQAVQVGGVNPDLRAALTREKLNRELLNYEKHWSSVATNMRCLDLPGAKIPKCTVTSEAAVSRRFREAQETEMAKLKLRRLPVGTGGIQLRPYDYQLNTAEDMRFEVIHIPECRRNQDSPKLVPYIIEQVKIQFDDWATPKITSLSQNVVNANVKSVTAGGAHEIEIVWPAPAAPYRSPNLDPRKTMGSRFHIDLPVCPG